MRELEGRTAVVTGAASGIGFATARALAGEGMRVVLADIEAGALGKAADALTGRRSHSVRESGSSGDRAAMGSGGL